jgi:hypothetical protein
VAAEDVPVLLQFARFTKTLRVTPAMEAGIADHVWTIEELVRLSEAKTQAAIAG